MDRGRAQSVTLILRQSCYIMLFRQLGKSALGAPRMVAWGRHAHAWGLTRPRPQPTRCMVSGWYWGYAHRVSAPGAAGVGRGVSTTQNQPLPSANDPGTPMLGAAMGRRVSQDYAERRRRSLKSGAIHIVRPKRSCFDQGSMGLLNLRHAEVLPAPRSTVLCSCAAHEGVARVKDTLGATALRHRGVPTAIAIGQNRQVGPLSRQAWITLPPRLGGGQRLSVMSDRSSVDHGWFDEGVRAHSFHFVIF
jgi:hypothetical protein